MGLAVNAQTVNIHGKVSDGTGKAVANATVSLGLLKHPATTGADGTYSLSFVVDALRRSPEARSGNIVMEQGVLRLSVASPSLVKIEVFDMKGNLVKREALEKVSAGIYNMDLAGKLPGGNLLIVKASIGGEVRTFQYFPTDNVVGQMKISLKNTSSADAPLRKVAATVDTLKVSATGFAAKSVPVASYDATMDVTLQASTDIWGGLKNAPIKSTGCGKALGSINKSGTYHISSGARGDYILDIPTGYDKDTPYRIIFGMHCLGGSAARVAAADNGDDLSGFYSMKTLATKDNIQCIYVAPQGDAGGTWNPSGDPKFFADILASLEDNLCIDTTRVFVTGFSFGAMFSYALSLAYPEKIRAVATYAPANWNFDPQPTNRHIPIAYYQTTGTDDGTCSWINNDAQKKGGKYCLLQHAQDNGCNTSGEIKLATNGTHVTTEFTGCNEGYPVKFGSFKGGHQAVASDPGSNVKNWIEVEAWDFFKRF